MEAKLNELTRLDLRSLCSKKLLGIPIDSVIKGRRKQFSKTDLIKKILEKGDINIQAAIDKKKHDPDAFLADDKNASDDDQTFINSPVKDMAKLIESKQKQQHEIIMHDAKVKKLAEDKGDEATRSFGKQYFKKWQNASEYKKMTKKELLELIDKQNDSEKKLLNEEFIEMRDIAINKYDNEGKVRMSDERGNVKIIEGQNRSHLEKDERANLIYLMREQNKKGEKIAQKSEPLQQKQGDILPKKPDEFEKEKAQQDQFKKITRKNVAKIDISVKVQDDNVKVKPNVKISDIKKAIQKNSSRLKLSKPPKIVYHSLKNMGKTALLTI